MYHCPDCKKKFREYRRRCPVCGGRCYRNDNRAILLIVSVGVLFLLLVGLIILMCSTGGISTDTSASSSMISSSVPESTGTPGSSAVPGTSAPATSSAPPATSTPATSTPATTTPVTSSPAVSGLGIYTRAELEAMDKTYNTGGFGAGRAPNHARPSTPVAEQKKYAQYGAHFIGEEIDTVYLTFDCGYEYTATDANGNKYRVTERILDVLKEKGVKAVFFVTMDYVLESPDLVQRMVDEGHAVGNHTKKHPVMPAQTIDRMEYEVMSLHDYVLENFGYKMTLFRPPTGAYSIQSLAVLQNLGYKSVLWSFQHFDYDTEKQPSEKTAYDTITKNAHQGAIYLLHAISEANAAALDDAIDYFRTEGYSIALFS